MRSLTIIFILLVGQFNAQTLNNISGTIRCKDKPVMFAVVGIKNTKLSTYTDSLGRFEIKGISASSPVLIVNAIGFFSYSKKLSSEELNGNSINIELKENTNTIEEIVVSGTLKSVSKSESPVPVEVYTSDFFKTNPTPSVFEAMQNVNGVRPQLNCNICNTGDIHINGLEGPYTMVLIDGMPIVSGLSTVYGLSGIPQAMIDRVEVVKGPASTLYGSEAVGGLINVITKTANKAPLVSLESFGTSWGEINTDVSAKVKLGKKAQTLFGASYFNYQNPIDNNNDGFTDLTLQNRISVFNKIQFERNENREFSIAGRYVFEDRFGGEMNWNKAFRGTDSVYGESIYTKRWELFGTYQLPIKEYLKIQFSANGHNQDSYYGNTPFMADQKIFFGQLIWNKTLGHHELLSGTTVRYIYYDDNTPATSDFDTTKTPNNAPSISYLPGVFLQDQWSINDNNKLLIGLRGDYNSIHGSIFSPRINYKWNSDNKLSILRISAGNGYRVANVFTEDHAALTGARKVEFAEKLNPETSYNINVNYIKKFISKKGNFLGLDGSVFYTYFNNKIIPDYTSDPNKIIYANLKDHAVSQGVSLNADISFNNGFKLILGGTYMDVYSVENGQKISQMLTEKFTGNWNITYEIRKIGLAIDYNGKVYGPMRLPILNALDPRSEYSETWSIQNIQITKKFKHNIEVFGGVKNLLNWTPNKNNPFIIARAHDPFDKNVQFDANGNAAVTTENPYGLTFDAAYVYGPNQGIRGFLGLRWSLE